MRQFDRSRYKASIDSVIALISKMKYEELCLEQPFDFLNSVPIITLQDR
jgi:hypothetical protein